MFLMYGVFQEPYNMVRTVVIQLVMTTSMEDARQSTDRCICEMQHAPTGESTRWVPRVLTSENRDACVQYCAYSH